MFILHKMSMFIQSISQQNNQVNKIIKTAKSSSQQNHPRTVQVLTPASITPHNKVKHPTSKHAKLQQVTSRNNNHPMSKHQ